MGKFFKKWFLSEFIFIPIMLFFIAVFVVSNIDRLWNSWGTPTKSALIAQSANQRAVIDQMGSANENLNNALRLKDVASKLSQQQVRSVAQQSETTERKVQSVRKKYEHARHQAVQRAQQAQASAPPEHKQLDHQAAEKTIAFLHDSYDAVFSNS
jgi:hypothetical protein